MSVMKGHPAPEVACVEVAPEDERVPKSARDAWRTAVVAQWDAVLTYAMGTAYVGKECGPGGVVESVALRLRRGTARAVAVWEAPTRAQCSGCGKDFLPLGSGLFRAHAGPRTWDTAWALAWVLSWDAECAYAWRAAWNAAWATDPCPGGGQPATVTAVGAKKREYSFNCAFTSGPTGWFNGMLPQRCGAGEFMTYLKSGV